MQWPSLWLAARLACIGICITSGLAPARAQPADTQSSVERGRQLYNSYCARCHGLNMVTSGAALDLRTLAPDEQERFERSVTQGLRAMPAWRGILKPGDVQALWLFVMAAR